MRDVLLGITDYTVLVKITATDGTPVTALAHTDIDIAYARVETDNDVTTADVAPAALSALTDAHTDWGWEELSATDHPGLYRLDIADAVFASGAWEAVVTITDASGTDFEAVDIGFRLVAYNPLDTVRLGLTALPNAAADAAGGLPISDAGGLDLDAQIGTDIDAILTDTSTTLQGELDGIQADTEDIQARLPAALTSDGNIKADSLRHGGTLVNQIRGLGKTIYVATTGNDSNAGTSASPKLTINGAIAAMTDGDTCVVGSGAFNATVSCALNHVTFEGQGQGVTTISVATGTGWTIIGDYNTVRNFSITTTEVANNKYGLLCASTWGTRLENLSITGTYDGIQALGAVNLKMAGCSAQGDYDGANFTSCHNFKVSGCSFYTTGAWDSYFDLAIVTPEANGYRGMFAAADARGTFRNCKFKALQERESTKHTVAVVVGGDDLNVSHSGVKFDNCKFYATNSHASSTGLVACLSTDPDFALAMFATVNGGYMEYSNAGSGANYHINATEAGSKVTLNGVMTHTTLTAQTIGYVTTDLRPTAAGRFLDVTTGGAAGIDWANVENKTTTNDLTATTISSSQVVASVTGAVGSVTGAVGSVTGAVGSVTGNVGGNVVGTVASVVGAVGSVTGNVGGNVTGSVGSIATGGIVAASIGADAFTAAKFHADVTTEFQAGLATAAALATVDGIVDDILVDTGTTLQAELDGIQADTEDIQARLPAALVSGRIDASVGAMAANVMTAAAAAADLTTELQSGLATSSSIATLQTSVDDLPTNAELATSQAAADDATLAAIAALNNISTAQVNAEVDAALADINLDHLVKIAVDTNFATTVHLDSVLGQIADAGTTATFDRTADSLEALRDRGDAAWITATGFSTLDAAGVRTAVGLAAANLDTQLGDLPTNAELATALAAADDAVLAAVATVDGIVDSLLVIANKLDDTLEDDGGTFRFTTNALEQAPTGGTAPTVGEIADAVWTEAIIDHEGVVGSTAESLNAAGSAGDPWTTALPGAYGSGSAGKIIGDNINATISSRATQTSVDDIPTNAELATSQAAADDATLAAIAALNNLSAAQVNAEVDTALADYDAPTNAEMVARTLAAASYATASAVATLQTSVDDVPTNAELATSQAAADDATLAAIATLQTSVNDVPTVAEFEARSLLSADYFVVGDYTAPDNAGIAAIEAKTDQLTFTVANKVDATADVEISQENIDEIAAGIGDALSVSPFLVDKDHTWRFDSPNQTTAPNIINEIVGFEGLLSMDFTEPMPARASISTIGSATFANVAGTEPTVTSSIATTNKKGVNILIDASAATAGTYTISVPITTTDSQTFVRKGRLTLT